MKPQARLSKALFCICVLLCTCGFHHVQAFPQSNCLLTSLTIRAARGCHSCSPSYFAPPPLHRRSFSNQVLPIEAHGGNGDGGPPRIGCSRSEGNSWWRGDDDNDGGENKDPGLKRRHLLVLSSLFLFAAGMKSTAFCAFARNSGCACLTYFVCLFGKALWRSAPLRLWFTALSESPWRF